MSPARCFARESTSRDRLGPAHCMGTSSAPITRGGAEECPMTTNQAAENNRELFAAVHGLASRSPREMRAGEIGRGLAVVGFMLLIVAVLLLTWRVAAGYALFVCGLVFFWCGGGMILPPWRITKIGWVLVLLGLAIIGLAAGWAFIYTKSWMPALAAGVGVVGLVLLAVGLPSMAGYAPKPWKYTPPE